MNFDEYERSNRARYLELVAAVRHILGEALKAHPNLHVHAITGRAKEPSSLRGKLEDRGIDLAEAIEEKIKDLAGCRVVLLTNAQMEGFGQTGIIRDNFEVLDVNVHHPVPGTPTETHLFDSNNFLVTLKPDRLAFPEYARFAGMRCEIQVQTLLNHAWAEMGHDTIYKQPSFKLGNKAFEKIKERMDNVMRTHLLAAGHDFDKIARDFDRIVKGNEVADDALRVIVEAENNNERSDALDSLNNLVIPLFEKPEQFAGIIPKLIEAAERARTMATVPIETPYYKLDGKSVDDVIGQIAEIFRSNRYSDPDLTFDALVRLHAGAATETDRRAWISVGEKFAQHDLRIWERYGPAVADVVVRQIETASEETRHSAADLFMPMLSEILSSQLEGTTASSTALTIQLGSVPASKTLSDLRSRAINVLMAYVLSSPDDRQRRDALNALRTAADTPHIGTYGNDVALMVATDTVRIYDFLGEHTASWGLEMRRWVEVEAHRCHYANRGLPPSMASDQKLMDAQQALVASLLRLRDLLNADPEFIRYKALIGHDSVRPEAWDGAAFDYDATDQWRDGMCTAMIAEITAATFAEWLDRIRAYMTEGGRDGTHAVPLSNFLSRLSREKPEIGAGFLAAMDDQLAPLLTALLSGLAEAGEHKFIGEYIGKFIEEGRFLYQILFFVRAPATRNNAVLARTTERAASLGELGTLIEAVNVAAEIHATDPGTLIEDVFMPAVDALAAAKRPDWVKGAWAARHTASIIIALNEEQSNRLLESFSSIPEVDYNADNFLAAVAGTHLDLVLDFFAKRLRMDRKEFDGRFSPIPFNLHALKAALSRHPDRVFDACRRWYADDSLLHEYRGGKLLKNVFPDLDKHVAETLIQIVRVGERDDLKFVLATLKAYEGKEAIYPICMEVVERLESGDEMLNSVSDTLAVTGVMLGEFGYVEAQAQQKALIDAWAGDERPKVRDYAAMLSRRLAQGMAFEQRMAEREIEGRRREYGEA